MTASVLTDRRILVVEDEMLVLMALEDMLDELGCRSIASAATVDTALVFAQSGNFDAAILDVNLSGERSYPVARALAARNIPFVFSTGYSDHGNNTEFRECAILHKPFRIGELTDICSRWFRLPRTQQVLEKATR